MADLPSLNGLRAFEAAARRGSIKEAAAELFVTPGAVSQLVKGLEESLDTPLFRRHGRGLALTQQGAELYPVLRESFQNIASALEHLKVREQSGPLTVTVVPSFAAKWLVPRLGRFRERHPEIDVRISATLDLVDLLREDVDMAIRYTTGEHQGLRSDWLLAEPIYPVCAPRLMDGARSLRSPGDLRFHTLLHDESPREWLMWLEQYEVEGVDASRGPVFNDASMALQAAIEGQGVALSRGELAARDLEEGRLVKPFDLPLPNEVAFYVVSPESNADWPKVAAFREWILEEAARAPEPASDPGAR